MIKIYRSVVNPRADAIEAEFKELVLGYDRVVIDEKNAARQFGAEHTLPVITDNQRLISGDTELTAYIKELSLFVNDWRLFQGDTCYADLDGNC